MSEPAVATRAPAARARHDLRTQVPDTAGRVRRRPRVAVVERHALVAEAIGLSLVGAFEAIPVPLQSCTTTAAARDAVLRARASIAVLVLSPGSALDTLTLVEQLSAYDVSVLVAGDDEDPAAGERYLCAGAAAYWCTGGVADVLREVTREADLRALEIRPARGPASRTYTSPSGYDDEHRARRDLASLTGAEAKILWALMRGRTADDIARDHVVSIATVRTQIKQVLGKLGAKSQLSAVALAWHAGWTPGGDLGVH